MLRRLVVGILAMLPAAAVASAPAAPSTKPAADGPTSQRATRPSAATAATRPADGSKGELSFEIEEPAEKEDLVYVLASKPDDVGEHRQYQRRIQAILAKLPKGHKVRVAFGSIYDPSHGRRRGRMHSLVPIDPNGQPDGVEQFFAPWGGSSIRQVPYRHGVKHGVEKIFFWSGGRHHLQREIPWDNGVLQGTKRTFYPDGTVQSQTECRNGVADGLARTFDKHGKLASECTMRGGKRNGVLKDYWPKTGKVRRIIRYEAGKVVGTMKEYYSNGQLKREVPFKNNAIHGQEKQYAADGTLVRIRQWQAGRFISEKSVRIEHGN